MLNRRVYHRAHKATGTVRAVHYDNEEGTFRLLVEVDAAFAGAMVRGDTGPPGRAVWEVWRPLVNWSAATCSVLEEDYDE